MEKNLKPVSNINKHSMEIFGGYSLLMVKVEEGNIDAVREILEEDQSTINFQNKSGQTALGLAVRSGNIPIVGLLVSAGADINLVNKVFGFAC